LIAACLILANATFNTLGNFFFKRSATGRGFWGFWGWQSAGNIIGFGGVLVYTAALHFLPMSVVFPVAQGLSVLGVQVIAARLAFKERIRPVHWLGTVLIIAGIILVGTQGK